MRHRRALDLAPLLQHRSLFLLGPRQTGKTTYLRARFPEAHYVDLLDARTYRELTARPERLRESLNPHEKLVIVDEIQKLPELLDEVHLMIEQRKELRFILTGSSARKLKRGGANLLAGRALTCRLHPLVSAELDFTHVEKRLSRGGLPAVFDSPIPWEDLHAYAGTYLQEEIQAEGLTRQISSFSRFLEIAAVGNGQLLNYTAIASDVGLTARTIQGYYQILEDTLVGHLLEPYRKSRKRKAVSSAKFFFFDVGVANVLSGRTRLSPRTPEYGGAFEHLVFLELRAYLDYSRVRLPLTFWRTHTQVEVDFVVGDHLAVEVKAKEQVGPRDLKGLRLFAEEFPGLRRVVVCQEREPRVTDDGIEILPLELFLQELWSGRLFSEE